MKPATPEDEEAVARDLRLYGRAILDGDGRRIDPHSFYVKPLPGPGASSLYSWEADVPMVVYHGPDVQDQRTSSDDLERDQRSRAMVNPDR